MCDDMPSLDTIDHQSSGRSGSIISLLEAAMDNPTERVALTNLMRKIVKVDQPEPINSTEFSPEGSSRFSTSNPIIDGGRRISSSSDIYPFQGDSDVDFKRSNGSLFGSDADSESLFDHFKISDFDDFNSATLTYSNSNMLCRKMAQINNFSENFKNGSNRSRRARKKAKKSPKGCDVSGDETIPYRYPSTVDNVMIKVLQQPERAYRARYATEGSRGSLKDHSQNSFPAIQLCGYGGGQAMLQVYVGSEKADGSPNHFYQITKTAALNLCFVKEITVCGISVLEFMFNPDIDMVILLDCVSIVRLRNSDVQKRFGRKDRKSTPVCHLVFRVLIPKPNNEAVIIQTLSTPIFCSQPPGQPEITYIVPKYSHSLQGGDDVVLIGKNFTKSTRVIFFRTPNMEMHNSTEYLLNNTSWTCPVDIDQDYSTFIHLLCRIPACLADLSDCPSPQVKVLVVVQCDGRLSDPFPFAYNKDPEYPKSPPKNKSSTYFSLEDNPDCPFFGETS